LDSLRAFDRKRVLSAINLQLRNDPLTVTRNRKPLFGAAADFEFEPPLRELKVGEFRVFFDVNEFKAVVNVRSVRWKPPGKTTAEVLG
jgi:hypothetical protein